MTSARLGIGPLNVASQGTGWCAAARSIPDVEAFSFSESGWLTRRLKRSMFNDATDRVLPHRRLVPSWYRFIRARRILSGLTHLLNESMSTICGASTGRSFADDFESAVLDGVRCGVVFHGSEVRDPKIHMEMCEYSYYYDVPSEWRDVIGKKVAAVASSRSRVDLPFFVSTPELVEFVSGSRWLPLTIDCEPYRQAPTAFTQRTPVVLHLPSRSVPPIKGTQYIEPLLEELDHQGEIRWLRSSPVGHNRMKDLYFAADIVIDQIQSGSYGVTAVEAMASGRLVISSLFQSLRKGQLADAPLLDANPRSLRTVLREAVADRVRSREMAERGRAFAAQVHGGPGAVPVLREFLGFDTESTYLG